ncbi:MAG TPA: sulfatase-like hydrolase/transferase, partial [Thermoanaerobaculia bacterium]
MGFQTFIRPEDMGRDGFQEANFLGYEDDTMLEPSARWLKAHRNKPLFAAYLTVNAHHDYNPLSRHGVHHFAPDDDLYDRYLNNVRSDDVFLRSLFAQYERMGLLRKTLFVIVGDHGEAFGEHGRRTHNTVPYEEALRVPLMIYDPSGEVVRPGRIATPVSQLDLMPTLLTALGYKLSSGSLHGVSLFEPARDRVLMASCLGSCATRTTASEAFIHHFGRRPDELFDLEHDPLERNDVAALHPELVAQRADEVRAFDRRLFSFYYVHTLHAGRPGAGGAPTAAQRRRESAGRP